MNIFAISDPRQACFDSWVSQSRSIKNVTNIEMHITPRAPRAHLNLS